MAKQLKDILKGVNSSKVEKGSLGKDPGVDYEPKPKDEQDFVAKHKVEKHEDRNGNKEDVFNASKVKYKSNKETNKGHNKGEDEKVYEAKEAESAKCNMTEAGKECPVHGMTECWSAKKINEDEKVPMPPARPKDMDKAPKKKDDGTMGGQIAKTGMKTFEEVEDIDEDSGFKDALPEIIKDIKAKKSAQELRQTHGTHYKRIANAASNVHGPKYTRAHLLDVAQTAMKEEVEIHEVLTKKTPVGKWIKDFVDSENSKFEGKSKKKRTQMALAAYYAKQRNEDLAIPLLGGDEDDHKSDELDMVKAELKALANKAMHLMMHMPKNMHVEPWVQAKLATAKSLVSDIHDYMMYGEHDKDDEKEESAPMDTPMTFPGMNVDQGRI